MCLFLHMVPQGHSYQVRSEKTGILQYGNKMPIGSFNERGDYSKEIRVTTTEMSELGNSLKAVRLPNIFAEISQAPRARRRDLGSQPT